MSDHDPAIDQPLSSSVVAFIGSVGHLDAVPPEERVARVAGNAAFDILPRIKAILDEVYSADPPLFQTASTSDMYWRVDAFLRGPPRRVVRRRNQGHREPVRVRLEVTRARPARQ
jgi:hypothetical protein